MQYLLAAALLAGYAVLCWYCLIRPHRRRRPGSTGDAPLLVAYASQSGRAEALARAQAGALQGSADVPVLPLDRVDDAALRRVRTALFVVSTYGEGEPPDNAQRFARQWLRGNASRELSQLRFAVLALGDSGYRQFCGFGTDLERGLAAHGATPCFPMVTLDARQGGSALGNWQQHLQRSGLGNGGPFNESDIMAHREVAFHHWRLTARRCLNAGSPGDLVFHLRFESAAPARVWRAGDIAVVALGDTGQEREYSIASVPHDGGLELLVRQLRKDDGSYGAGSGWLTRDLPLDGSAWIGVRSNPAFHGPSAERPLILAGNGSGMAGLRAHLRERAGAGASRNWLLFGERSAAHDLHFASEIRAWRANGLLQRLDLAWSRDGAERRYVQHALADAADELREWLADGAAVYVCGSVRGMAPAVHQVLVDVIGASGVEQLARAGGYRRDVY